MAANTPLTQTYVAEKYRSSWGSASFVVARAPGRVNLIGEHIDYEGYGVLPMAVEQACFVAAGWEAPGQPPPPPASSAAAPASFVMHVRSVTPAQYPDGELPLQPDAPFPSGATPQWLSYVQAAYKGCAEFAASKQQPVPQHCSILLMVGSSIPPAAGLSSSSALVVATALALLALWDIQATPSEVAEFTCRCERFVGTQGGGMDQAVSVLAQAGRAMHVEFSPVRTEPVPLPAGGMFVVANSLAPSAKAETASYRFNLRVLECRLAAMLLAHKLSSCSSSAQGLQQWRDVTILKQVEAPLLQLHTTGCSGADPATALTEAVQELLPEAFYTMEQVVQLLGTSQQQLMELLPQGLQAAAAAASQLHLRQRACHVFSEAQRVLTFKSICEHQQMPAAEKLQQLGALLNASHTSCAELYQCSCEELDTLVDTARAAGALGARLTGAGWGGCMIALVQQHDVEAFKQRIHDSYYKPLVAQGVITDQDVPLCLFATSPSAGAQVTKQRLSPEDSPAAGAAQAAAVREPGLATSMR